MKKILCIVLAMTMGFMAACGNANGNEDANADQENAVAIESADAALNQVWDTYAEDEKFVAIGGDASNMTDGKAGLCNLEDTESLNAMLHIPAELVEYVEEAASLMHAMNANIFTCAAYKLKTDADKDLFAATLEDAIINTQWMCGFPEKLVVYMVGDYVVAAFGNGEIMDTFVAKLTEVYGENAVLFAEKLIA